MIWKNIDPPMIVLMDVLALLVIVFMLNDPGTYEKPTLNVVLPVQKPNLPIGVKRNGHMYLKDSPHTVVDDYIGFPCASMPYCNRGEYVLLTEEKYAYFSKYFTSMMLGIKPFASQVTIRSDGSVRFSTDSNATMVK
jgi:hypothetical protein